MTIKQGTMLGAIPLILDIIIDTVARIGHVQENVPLGLIVSSALYAGIIMGWLEHKWKRDKEMASIVATRLMGKPNTPEPTTAAGVWNSPGQAANTQQANTLGAMQQSMSSAQEKSWVESLSGVGKALGK